ncbi:MAG: hypothetical protein KF733_03225 [Fimbriimonadaceae bacterium]|nr:MAG: hypothetical protein KF733_03225 [Fimbriimonadaceae bacterium]
MPRIFSGSPMVHFQRIGEMLIHKGLLSQDQLQEALKAKLSSNMRFGEVLTALGYVTEEDVTLCLADQYGYEVVDLDTIVPEPEALEIVPAMTAITGLVLPVRLTNDKMFCVVADPLDIWLTDSLMRLAGRAVDFQLSAPSPLFDAIVRHYQLDPHSKRAHEVAKSGLTPAEPPHRLNFAPPATGGKPPRRKRPVKIYADDDRFELLEAVTRAA